MHAKVFLRWMSLLSLSSLVLHLGTGSEYACLHTETRLWDFQNVSGWKPIETIVYEHMLTVRANNTETKVK